VQLWFDTSRRSLPELVVQFLDGCVGKSLYDEINYPSEGQQVTMHQWLKMNAVMEGSDAREVNEAAQRRTPDDAEEVQVRLTRLAKENDCHSLFEVGRKFGGLYGLCNQLEQTDIDSQWMDECDYFISETEFGDRVLAAANSIRQLPEVGECAYGILLLDRVCGEGVSRLSIDGPPPVAYSHGGHVWGPSGLVEERESGYVHHRYTGYDAPLVAHVRNIASVALGELLGTLKNTDAAAHEKDAVSPTPRMFALSRDSAVERVKGQVYLLEKEMNDRTASGMLPENIVSMLSNAIEALARQIWPEDFDQAGRRGGFEQVLAEKSRSKDELETKFAHLGRTLYKTYRNPAAHELATYECSWDEARFFVDGIRTLLDLRNRIKGRVSS